MRREIVGFVTDEAGGWVALLDCRHRQHVRHRPPFRDAPWVLVDEEREQRIGTALDCPRCDRCELPPDLWGRLRVETGSLRFVAQGVLADRVGVDFLGVGEHHRDDFAVTCPEVVLAAIAGQTDRIRLGSAVTVVSSDDPVRRRGSASAAARVRGARRAASGRLALRRFPRDGRRQDRPHGGDAGLVALRPQVSNGPLPHEQSMRAIELYGTAVIPRVRELLAESSALVAV